MKKNYVSPLLEEISFENIEVLTSSFSLDIEDPLPDPTKVDEL